MDTEKAPPFPRGEIATVVALARNDSELKLAEIASLRYPSGQAAELPMNGSLNTE